MILYIIRHGEPHYPTDSLTENGIRQANALAESLAKIGLDEIYSSPLGRAIQTAEPTCEILNLPYSIEEWMSEDLMFNDISKLDENGVRDWAMFRHNTQLMKQEYTLDDWYTNPLFNGCRDAKGAYERVVKNSDEFLARLGYTREGRIYKITKPGDKRIAAFCHHGFGTTWLSHLMSIQPNAFWASFTINHSSVTIIEFDNNNDGYTTAWCRCLNDTSHLYRVDGSIPVIG
ncbi:MAG: histidine phosphatase family protein [Oscillospiraceae bacterium]|jgi:probable phosphoglycerate mutase|nr:histidine phosphatase family protein [Oscillospiraceae bacterium]